MDEPDFSEHYKMFTSLVIAGFTQNQALTLIAKLVIEKSEREKDDLK
jgi:hypothetical protein